MQQKDVIEIMKMGDNVYLTGEAGTGKTYVLNQYIRFLKKKDVAMGITASTGIAATHINGVTIDSWSGVGIRDDVTESDLRELAHKHHLVKRLQTTRVLIIDEISMIAGRRFDAVDRVLRSIRQKNQPFGGIQVILCGDLFQLPPVSEDRGPIDYIFKSRAWKELNLQICYLHVPRRQSDQEFLQLLGDIRHNQVTESTREILQRTMKHTYVSSVTPTKLFTHNVDVDAMNVQELEKISGDPHVYYMTQQGPEALTTMMKRTCLAPARLELKKGALVMFVRNNYELGYANGTLGVIVNFNKKDDPIVRTTDGKMITVVPVEWTISEEKRVIAQITQMPLRLAWAITVHKSQGMTLDAAEIDLSKSFVEGMGYVALSRVRSLRWVRLLGFNDMALRVHPEVSAFDEQLRRQSAETARRLQQTSWIKRWWRKRQFIYRLSS